MKRASLAVGSENFPLVMAVASEKSGMVYEPQRP